MKKTIGGGNGEIGIVLFVGSKYKILVDVASRVDYL
jgi:hypothetical protein